MGLLDRGRQLLGGALEVAEQVAPGWALRREVARARRGFLAQGYSQHGASRSNKAMAGWVTARGGPDADITLNLDLLRQRSRDLFMGEPLASGALRTIRTNELGAGLRLNAQIDARLLGLTDEQALAWEEHTEREFALWAGTSACDSARRCNFGELQELARLSQLMSGDVFALLPAIDRGDRYDLRVKLLEADRVCDPWPYPVGKNVLGGVEVGEDGEAIAYYVTKIHPGDLFLPGTLGGYGAFAYGAVSMPPLTEGGIYGAQWNKWERIDAYGAETGRRTVLHIMDSERPGQRRGVPVLAAVMERFKQLSRYSDAEIMAAVVSGFFTVAITSEQAQAQPGTVLPPGQVVSDPTDPTGDKAVQLGNGTIMELAPGEKVEGINPARPSAQFEPFVSAVCRQIAAGLPGMTYGLLLKTFNASYSASRAELLEAWKSFTVGRRRIAERFCQPIYEQWLEEAILRGYIDAPGFFSDPVIRAAWCGAEWHGPAQGQLDPTKEVAAAEARVAGGFSTRTRETAELTGGNWERNARVREREERIRRETGVIPSVTPPTGSGADPEAPGGASTDDKAAK